MEAEFPAQESDYPEVVNLHDTEAACIQAELVRASASTIKQLNAQEVDLRNSWAVVVNADTVNARKTGIAHLEAGNFTLLEGTVIAAKTNASTINGRAGVVISDSTRIDNGSSGVLISREVHGENIRTGILISRNVDGNVETLMDTRSTVLAGLVAGAVVGSILMLGQFLFRRK
jgi:hypothetical protein